MTLRTAVVGAGLMGAEIAFIQALAGHQVVIIDRSLEAAQAGLSRLETLFDKGVARGFFSADGRSDLFNRLDVSAELTSAADCGLVTEAVFEDLAVKHGVLAALDVVLPPEAVIATNTSTLPISTLAAALTAERRGRFIGMHYFSPVSRMPLIEVIPAFETSEDTLTQAMDLARAWGKTPIQVKDVPGFAVNRMLHAFIIEAVKLVEEGVATPADLDAACRLGLGHAMGPFELMDAVTSSLCVQAQEIMHDAYGDRFRPPSLLKQRVAAGLVGGRGRPGWRT